MSDIPTRNEILDASSATGLMAYLFDVSSNFCPTSDAGFLTTVAELVASGERTLFSERDWKFLDEVREMEFFRGMYLLCELIVLLDVEHGDMMRLVATLVRLGGEDGASNQPNAAFRRWCRADPARIEAVIADARGGDPLAINHLSFALEAGSRASDAIAFLTDGPGAKTRIVAATALGRMQLGPVAAASAVRVLSQASIEADNSKLRYNALLSCFSVLEKNPRLPRKNARRALDKVLLKTSPEACHVSSLLLRNHRNSLTKSEVTSVLKFLESVDLDDHNVVKEIDSLVSVLTSDGYFEFLCNLIAELIKRSAGELNFNSFPKFRHELLNASSRHLGQLVINWLLEGNLYLCASVAQLFNADRKGPSIFDIEPNDLPVESTDQLFVCRKAIGFLFHAPVAAASVLIAVLRYGDKGIANDVCSLLYRPLLISFEGELRRYLEIVIEQGPKPMAAHINDLLARKDNLIEGLSGIGTLAELHPTERQRQIFLGHQQQLMTQSMKASMERSVLYKIASIEHILYGAASSSYIDDPSGQTRRVDMQFAEHSFSFELPALEILDPEGIQMALWQFRNEQRTAQ